MSTKRLTIAQLQIFFDDDGSPECFDTNKRDRVAVETALIEYRDFIERWLEESERKKPRYITEEEHELRATLKRLGRDLSRPNKFKADFIETVIREVAKYFEERSSSLTPMQVSESVKDAISSL
jgi:hypothetical protein